MKAILFSFLTIFIIMIGGEKSLGQDPQEKINVLTPSDEKIIKLFNCHSLDGCYTFLQNRGRENDPISVFTLIDGMIQISGEEWGCITTNAEYSNFKLIAEYNWIELTPIKDKKTSY